MAEMSRSEGVKVVDSAAEIVPGHRRNPVAQHSTLFRALKEAFLDLSAAQPGFSPVSRV